ncbi:MAG: DUF624 domain-containing protein [Clostridia bacterium]|nr:DUF624 domain-containing protein [Clostridia bacterium]MDD4679695.1 DUF624 domain-containing protein [Clostridia bacterium]
MAGFFNRMYYGDPRKPDLKKEDTQGSRFKLFFTVLSVRFWQLIQLNLLSSIFWVPSILLLYMQGLIMQETGEPVTILFFLLMIICLMIAGPATAAMTYIVRNWSRDEHAWVWSDFKDAWKENWKQGLIMMLINSVLLLVLYVNLQFYGAMVAENILFMILYYMMYIIAIVIGMMNMFIFPLMVTYRLSIKHLFRNAFILTMVKLPFTFLVFAVAVVLTVLSLLYILSLPFFLVGITFPALIVLSYVNWIFDKYINDRMQEEGLEEEDKLEYEEIEAEEAEEEKETLELGDPEGEPV